MSQSEGRVPGRAGKVPASFGREAPEDFTIKEGQALHLVLHLDVRADPKSLEVLRAAVRDATRAAVLDGYAQAFEEMDTPDPPPAGDGPEPDAPAGG